MLPTRMLRAAVLASALVLAPAACDSAPTASSIQAPTGVLLNTAPVAKVNLTVLGTAYCGPGACVYDYRYDAFESTDADGTIVAYEWIENGYTVSTSSTYYVTALRAYEGCRGTQLGTLRVTDNTGATHSVCYGYTPA
jgi:YD repeat-containing protein